MRTERALALTTTVILLALAGAHLFWRFDFLYDILISLAALLLFVRYGERFHQDRWSLAAFCGHLILHNLGLYDIAVIGFPWDKWLHLYGGFTIAVIIERMYSPLRLSFGLRACSIVMMTLGIGGLHEIIEWFGYAVYGAGEGFLKYGVGDFGEWQDAITDMTMNLLGALLALIVAHRRNKS